MKYIRRGRSTAELERFKRDNASTPHLIGFDQLPGDVKRALQRRMLKDQGRLCAYTMRRIGEAADFHIEHIRPQSRYPEFDLAYVNLVACAPGGDQPHCEWGARSKGEMDVAEESFVSPLRSDCETRFAYLVDGSVKPADTEDGAAVATIEVLRLNHRELISLRIAAFAFSGFGRAATRPITAKAAAKLQGKLAERDSSGDFTPFCIAIQQVAARFSEKARQRSARMRSER